MFPKARVPCDRVHIFAVLDGRDIRMLMVAMLQKHESRIYTLIPLIIVRFQEEGFQA